MANTTSAKKMLRKITVRTERNRIVKSQVRTSLKKVEAAIQLNKADEARTYLIEAESKFMSAAQKGIFKKNAASRKVSRLSKRIKSLTVDK